MKKERPLRSAFRKFYPMPTRWNDNDAYGHINNVVYYEYVDTAVNLWLVENGLLDIEKGAVINLVAETGCTFFESAIYPEVLEIGLAVSRLGNSSVTYAAGIFRRGHDQAIAAGHFVHVAVDRATQTPVQMSDKMRECLGTLLP